MALLKKITQQPPKMWGPSIVGYGSYRYTYESGVQRRLLWRASPFVAGGEPLAANLLEIKTTVADPSERGKQLDVTIGFEEIRPLFETRRAALQVCVAENLANIKH
jgi:hypothetical protein